MRSYLKGFDYVYVSGLAMGQPGQNRGQRRDHGSGRALVVGERERLVC